MLRLEKKDRDNNIHISLRTKEPVINRPLLLAFFLAIGVHLLAILLFHIKPFGLGTSEFVHSPVSVTIDLNTGAIEDTAALAQIDQGQISSRYILEPPVSKPHLPEMEQAHLIRQMEYIKVNDPLINPFASTEKDMLQAPSFAIDPPFKEFIPLSIHISGTLAFKQTMDFTNSLPPSLLKPVPCIAKNLVQQRAIYAVQVEDKTGQIFLV